MNGYLSLGNENIRWNQELNFFSFRFNKFSRVRKSAVKVFRAGDKFWLPFNFLYDTSEAGDLDIFWRLPRVIKWIQQEH